MSFAELGHAASVASTDREKPPEPEPEPKPGEAARGERDESASYVEGPRFYIIFSALVLACLLVALNGSMVGTVSPRPNG